MSDATEAAIARAKRASTLMEEGGVFREAWGELETRITAEWRMTAPSEGERRENLHRLLQAMTALENILAGYVDSGAVALHGLEQIARDRLVAGQ
jgi:hypothetical protein